MAVFARADVQSISAVPGCDQQHVRPVDHRTGLPVHLWELTCEAHEAWITGADRPKVMLWEKDGDGAFRQRWVSQMEPTWARSAEEIPLTPDQMRAEARRNSLTRRAESAMLAEGFQNTRLALEDRPAARELLRTRVLSGRGAVKMATCHSCRADYQVGAQFCPQCAVRVTVPAATVEMPAPGLRSGGVVDVPQAHQEA